MSHSDTVKVGQKGFSEADKNIQAENENLRRNVDPPPLPISSLSVLSSDCFLSHKQSKSQPPGNLCSQGLVLVLLQTLLHTEPVHNCTVSASHE